MRRFLQLPTRHRSQEFFSWGSLKDITRLAHTRSQCPVYSALDWACVLEGIETQPLPTHLAHLPKHALSSHTIHLRTDFVLSLRCTLRQERNQRQWMYLFIPRKVSIISYRPLVLLHKLLADLHTGYSVLRISVSPYLLGEGFGHRGPPNDDLHLTSKPCLP